MDSKILDLDRYIAHLLDVQQSNMLDRTKCSMTARNVYNHLTGSDDMAYNNNLSDTTPNLADLAVQLRTADASGGDRVYYVHFDHVTGESSHYFILLQLHGHGVILLQSAVFEFSIHDWLYPVEMRTDAYAAHIVRLQGVVDDPVRSKLIIGQLERDLKREQDTSRNIQACRYAERKVHAVEAFVADFVDALGTLEGVWTEEDVGARCRVYVELFGCRLEAETMANIVRGGGCKAATFKFVSNPFINPTVNIGR